MSILKKLLALSNQEKYNYLFSNVLPKSEIEIFEVLEYLKTRTKSDSVWGQEFLRQVFFWSEPLNDVEIVLVDFILLILKGDLEIDSEMDFASIMVFPFIKKLFLNKNSSLFKPENNIILKKYVYGIIDSLKCIIYFKYIDAKDGWCFDDTYKKMENILTKFLCAKDIILLLNKSIDINFDLELSKNPKYIVEIYNLFEIEIYNFKKMFNI